MQNDKNHTDSNIDLEANIDIEDYDYSEPCSRCGSDKRICCSGHEPSYCLDCCTCTEKPDPEPEPEIIEDPDEWAAIEEAAGLKKPVKEDRRAIKVIQTGISPDYVKNWDVTLAIREVLQNYLDSKAEFNCGGSITYEDGQAKVKDNGPGLELRHLAMGISEKGEDSIGKFGEGLKLAMLVMAREGRDIEVWSNGKIIKPIIEYSEDYETETLNFHMKDMYARHAAKFVGTSVKFMCDKDELDLGREFFIELTPKSRGINWIVKDKLSTPGEIIYVNGAAVGHIEGARFSYHIHGADGASIGNRDRSTINQDDITPIAKRYLTRSRNMQVMRTILQDLLDEQETYETRIGLNPYAADSGDRKLWKRSINEIFGKNTVVQSENPALNRQAEYKGFEVISLGYVWNEHLKSMGMDGVEDRVKPKKKKVKVIKRSDLMPEEKRNLETAIRLVKRHYSDTVGTVVVAESLKEKAGMSEDRDASGLWVPSENKIYIKRSQLTDREDTLHTILHETVHKVTGTSDCTSEFERALTDVAVKMMLKGDA